MDLGLIKQLPKKLQPVIEDANYVTSAGLVTRLRFSSAQLEDIKKAAVKHETFAAEIHGNQINGISFGPLE